MVLWDHAAAQAIRRTAVFTSLPTRPHLPHDNTAYMGDPTVRYICTSYVERTNLTMPIFQRRFTRLSLGFSRKMENLLAAVALHFAYYNFCWKHRTLGMTPAMAVGITDRRWEIEELIEGC